jgi:hypothetical protein
MRHLTATLFFLLLLILPGCPANLDPPRYPTTAPATSDLVGTYRPTAETTTLNLTVGKYPPTDSFIELRADGTFTIHNIPDWWRTDFGKPTGGFDHGTGTWKTAKQQSWWYLELEFPDRKAFATPTPGTLITGANLIGQTPPYDLNLTIGDPDTGRELRFTPTPPTTTHPQP